VITLRVKLFALIAGVTIFSTTGVTAVALWRDLQRSQELLAREGSALAASVAPAAARWVGPNGAGPGARDALGALATQLVNTSPIARAWVVDRFGKVLACADPSGRGCPEGAPTVFTPPQSPMETVTRLVEPEGIVVGAPVLRDGELVGAVRIEFEHEQVLGSAQRLALTASALAAVWIFLGHVLAVVLLRTITRPLTEVGEAADALARDEAGLQLAVPQERELSEVVKAFNHMSQRLSERRTENERLIGSLEERVAQKTRDVLRADRLATLGGIAAGFAHELGNSLNVIRGFTAVALRELPGDHPNRPDLEAVRRETQRAAGLLERFLVFARSRDAVTAPQSIEPVLREAVEVVGPAAAQARVETSVEVAAGLPEVNADAAMLRQAFLNLCVNAVQAMEGGGALRVSARARDGEVWVEFQDSGPGISPEVRGHVFEPFYTTKASGTGLGLAIVRQAAETHGGAVEVESPPGGGAIFRMRLPAAAGGQGGGAAGPV
jgi:signal transduction histidine kinase